MLGIPEPLLEVAPYAVRAGAHLIIGVRQPAGSQASHVDKVQAAVPPATLVDVATDLELPTEYDGRTRRPAWARLVVPAGTRSLVAETRRRGEPLTYTLDDPDDTAPRRFPPTLTRDGYLALARELAEADDDDRLSVHRWYSVTEYEPDTRSLSSIPLPDLELLPDLVHEPELADWQLIARADEERWTPSPALVQVFGRYLGPWLPGTLPTRQHVLHAVEQHTAWSPVGRWDWERKGTVELHLEQLYDPPRFVEVVVPKSPRSRTKVRVAKNETRRLTRLVNPPDETTGTSFQDAWNRRAALTERIITELNEAATIHPCGHCAGTGIAPAPDPK